MVSWDMEKVDVELVEQVGMVSDVYALSTEKPHWLHSTPIQIAVGEEVGTHFGGNFYRPPTTGQEKMLFGHVNFKPNTIKRTSTKINLSTFVARIGDLYGGQTEWGTDPEIFVVGADKDLIPAWEFCPANSKEGVFADGFAAEFRTIANPCLSYLMDDVQRGLRRVLLCAKGSKGRLTATNFFEFTPEHMTSLPGEMTMLGCNPSLSAYGLEPVKANGREVLFRSAGGHIHFGMTNKFTCGKAFWTSPIGVDAVKFLDVMLGIPAVLMAEGLDNPMRRTLYGRAGEYRAPKHGLEYRVLSNFWLVHPVVAMMVFEWARTTLGFGLWGLRQYLPVTDAEVRRAIDMCDVKLARDIWTRVQPMVQEMVKRVTGLYQFELAGRTRFLELITTPILKTVEDVEDIAGNWKITSEGWVGHSESKNCSMSKSKWFEGCSSDC